MTAISKNTDTLASAFLEAFYSNNSANAWADLVEAGADYLQEKGLPAPKDEEYKFTPISRRIASKISHLDHTRQYTHTIDLSALLPQVDGYAVVINNGRLDLEKSTLPGGGVQVDRFGERNLPEKLGKIAIMERDPFVALNQVAFQEGIYIKIPENLQVDKPIVITQIVSPGEAGQTVHPRTFISAGKNSQATFIEQVVTTSEEAYLLNGVTEVSLADNCHLHYYRVQDEGKSGIEVNNTVADIPRDSVFTSVVLSLRADMIRNNLSLNLTGSNSVGNMYGLYLTNGETHVDNHTNVDHTKPHAESNELYKGVLADRSRGVFNGKIFVRQDAQKTNAFQQNNNILLSEDAVVNTKPQLEIWADDVKCSHGCTTGQLDEEALFYLRTRGISKEAGKALLLYAFAGEVLDHIEHEGFRDHCVNLVQERLGSNYAS